MTGFCFKAAVKTLHSSAPDDTKFVGAERLAFILKHYWFLCSYGSESNKKAKEYLLNHLNSKFSNEHSPTKLKSRVCQ